jgi:hypothetical protein
MRGDPAPQPHERMRTGRRRAGKPVDQFHILGKITGKIQAALREQNER